MKPRVFFQRELLHVMERVTLLHIGEEVDAGTLTQLGHTAGRNAQPSLHASPSDRVPLRCRRPTHLDVHVQAHPHPGDSLSVAAHQRPTVGSSTDCPSAARPVSWSDRAQLALLAYHYTEAGCTGQAIAAWQRAGQQAVERSAHVEAITHFTQGLALLQELPDTPERSQQELLLQTSLGPALMATKGFAALEVERVYARARELCQQVGETPQLFAVLRGRGLWRYYGVRADFQTAHALGEQLPCLAQLAQDAALLLEAHLALGSALFWGGDFVAAQAHLEQVGALYDPQRHPSHALRYGLDPGVVGLSYTA